MITLNTQRATARHKDAWLCFPPVPGDSLQQRERNPQAQLSGHIGQRVARGLTGQRRAPRQTGIHLNDIVLE